MPATPLSRVGLIARLKLPQALATLSEAAGWLASHGASPVIETESAKAAGVERQYASAPRESFTDGVDVVLVFGGDGTLLDAAGIVAHAAARSHLVSAGLELRLHQGDHPAGGTKQGWDHGKHEAERNERDVDRDDIECAEIAR